MKLFEKKGVLALIVVLIIVIVIVVIFKTTKENKGEEKAEEYVEILDDGTKLNVSEQLKESKKIDGVEITDIQLTEQNGQSVLLANAINTTNTETVVMPINIIVLDKSGNEIGKIPGVIAPLKQGETKQLNVGITEDYSNAYDFKIEKQK